MNWASGQVSPFAFRRTGDEDFPRWINALLLGPPKSGKTTFISTFPNVVVADVEAGLMSIAHKNVPYVTIDNPEKLQTLLFVLRDESMRTKAAEQMGLEKIESVSIDTLDALQVLFKKERLRSENRTVFEKGDWGWLLDQFRELIKGFVELPMHTILTCHTKTVHIDEEHAVVQPGLQGAIAEEVAGMVGFSMMTHRTREVDQQGQPYTRYSLQVEGDDKNPHLGNRAMGRLAGFIEPTFDVLHAAIFEGLQLNPQSSGQVNVEGRVEVQTPVEAQAQAQAQAEAQPPPQAAAQETGGPPPDDAQMNAAAKQHLERMLQEWGFRLPPNANEWTMGFARDIGRMFVATKEGVAKGEQTEADAKTFLMEFLMAQDAWVDPGSVPPVDGTIDDLMEWVGDDPEKAAIALEAEKAGKDRDTAKKKLESKLSKAAKQAQPAQDEQPAPEPEPQPEPEPAPQPAAAAPAPQQPAQDQGQQVPPQPQQPEPAQAEPEPQAQEPQAQPEPAPAQSPEQQDALIASELDGVKIDETPAGSNGRPAKADLLRIEKLEDAPPSSASGKPIDDLDIAKLALSRFDEWLTVDEYIAKTNAAKA